MAIFSVSLSREVTMPHTYPSQGRSSSAGSSDSSSSLDASRSVSVSPLLDKVRGGSLRPYLRSGSPILMRSESRVRGGMPARFPRCSMNADPTVRSTETAKHLHWISNIASQTLFAGDLLRPFAHDVVLHPLPPSLVRLHAREPSKAAVPRMYDRESTSSLASHAVSIHGCTYCTIEPALRSGAYHTGCVLERRTERRNPWEHLRRGAYMYIASSHLDSTPSPVMRNGSFLSSPAIYSVRDGMGPSRASGTSSHTY